MEKGGRDGRGRADSRSGYRDDRERERERGRRDRDKEVERDRDRDREREREREKEREKERDKERAREKEKDRERDKEREREHERERERERGKEREKERDRERGRDGDRDRDREWVRESQRSREKSGTERSRGDHHEDRDRERPRDKDRARVADISEVVKKDSDADTRARPVAHSKPASQEARPVSASGSSGDEKDGEARRVEEGELHLGNDDVRWDSQRRGSEDEGGVKGKGSPPSAKKRKYSPIIWEPDSKGTPSKRVLSAPSLPPPPPRPPPSVLPQIAPPLPPPPPPSVSAPPSPHSVEDSPKGSNEGSPKQGTEDLLDSPVREERYENGTSESDEFSEPGQIREDSQEMEEEAEDLDEGGRRAPVTIKSSRWAEDMSPDNQSPSPRSAVKRKRARSPSGESDQSRSVHGRTDRESGSPEAGEYIQERTRNGAGDESDVGKDDEEYERELNMKELADLDGEDSEDEEQRPDSDSEEEEPLAPSGLQYRTIDMLQSCRSVDDFERLNRIDEGTYGVVYRARDKKTGEVVALKKVKMDKEKDGFPMTSLREINILLSFHHPSIVDVKEVVVGSNLDSIFMVMEYMEHDMKALMEAMKQPFSPSEVKCLMLQLLEGTQYLHDNWVLHRDLKTSNLLLNNRGELKICDFGLARQYGSPLKAYTKTVVTLWYRAPELLLGAKMYSTAIDMWSLGCIMAELLSKEPLFNGKTEIDQIDKIFKLLGTPNDRIWPAYATLPSVNQVKFVRQPYNKLRERFPPMSFAGKPALSDEGFDLLNKLLTYDPDKRITAEEALEHAWFKEVPLPKAKELMPTFPARSEHDRRMRRLQKSPDPLEEQRQRELRKPELGAGGLFG